MNLIHHEAGPICPLCESKLAAAHPYLINWFRSLKKKYINVHLSWAYRNLEEQELAVAEGKSKLHYPDSAHNKMPAMALDLFQEDEDGVARWSVSFFNLVNSENVTARLPIRWGGRWKTLGDNDHFEYDPGPSISNSLISM